MIWLYYGWSWDAREWWGPFDRYISACIKFYFSLKSMCRLRTGLEGLTLWERATLRCFDTPWLPECSLAGPVLTNALAQARPWIIRTVLLSVCWLKSRAGGTAAPMIRKWKALYIFFLPLLRDLFLEVWNWQVCTVSHSVYLPASRIQAKLDSAWRRKMQICASKN